MCSFNLLLKLPISSLARRVFLSTVLTDPYFFSNHVPGLSQWNDCSVTRSAWPASPPTRVTRLGGFTETEAAKLGADGEEKAGLNCGWDLGGAEKQPAVEVSGSCWGGELLVKVRTNPSSLKES